MFLNYFLKCNIIFEFIYPITFILSSSFSSHILYINVILPHYGNIIQNKIYSHKGD